jgi:hypothetical protein
MEEVISELGHSNRDMCKTKVMKAIDDQDENNVVDFETEYDETDNGEDVLLYNLSVNGVFDDYSDTKRYFPQFFAEIGI